LADDAVLVGGGVAVATKRQVARRLEDALAPPVETVSTGEYAGVSSNNFVNWLADDGGGLQIEQAPAVRTDAAGAVVEALEGLVRDGVL